MKKNLSLVGLLFLKLLLYLVIIFTGWFVFEIDHREFYYCLVGLFGLTIFWLVVYQFKVFPAQTQSIIQIVVDVPLENVLIHFSGGMESPFVTILVLDLILAAYILPGRKLFVLSCYVSTVYAIFSTYAILGLLPRFLVTENLFEVSPRVYFYYVVYMRVFIFFMIGYLASQLSGHLFIQKATIAAMQNVREKMLFQMKSGLLGVDEQDRIIFSNKSAADVLGHDNEALKGKTWQPFFLKKGGSLGG